MSDIQIYHNAIVDELPISLVATLHGISRQAVHQKLNRMLKEYGGTKPDYCVTLGPIHIPQEIKEMLESESDRLGIPQAGVIRIAINQVIADGLELTELGEFESGGTTPMMKITEKQSDFISTQKTNKSQTILLILKSYQPFNLEMKNE